MLGQLLYRDKHPMLEAVDPALVAHVAAVLHVLAALERAEVAARAVGRRAGRFVDARDAHHAAALAVVGVTAAARSPAHAGRGRVGVVAAANRRRGTGA